VDNGRVRAGDFDLTMDELRAVVRFAIDCAQELLPDFEAVVPEDSRPRGMRSPRRVSLPTALRGRTCSERRPSRHTAQRRLSLMRPLSSLHSPAATPRRPRTFTRSSTSAHWANARLGFHPRSDKRLNKRRGGDAVPE